MKIILDQLKQTTPPRLVREALALLGIIEIAGPGNNPVIINWAKETNTPADNWYNSDSIPWCGLFMAVVAQRAEWPVVAEPLRALSWATFGKKVTKAVLGDVLTFKRKGGGHVGIYVGETLDSYYVLGGNQSDKVCMTRIAKARIYSINRPLYKVVPASAIQYVYTSQGTLSTDEA
jgi:uncharacterized protein (TIGR02594 family)